MPFHRWETEAADSYGTCPRLCCCSLQGQGLYPQAPPTAAPTRQQQRQAPRAPAPSCPRQEPRCPQSGTCQGLCWSVGGTASILARQPDPDLALIVLAPGSKCRTGVCLYSNAPSCVSFSQEETERWNDGLIPVGLVSMGWVLTDDRDL